MGKEKENVDKALPGVFLELAGEPRQLELTMRGLAYVKALIGKNPLKGRGSKRDAGPFESRDALAELLKAAGADPAPLAAFDAKAFEAIKAAVVGMLPEPEGEEKSEAIDFSDPDELATLLWAMLIKHWPEISGKVVDGKPDAAARAGIEKVMDSLEITSGGFLRIMTAVNRAFQQAEPEPAEKKEAAAAA